MVYLSGSDDEEQNVNSLNDNISDGESSNDENISVEDF
jgi:hypothetical protein